jgi:hypothetical protein
MEQREKRRQARARRITVSILASIVIVLSTSLVFALISRNQALTELRRNQQLLYVADMKAAFQAAEREDVAEVRRLLEAHLPTAGTDLRRFEWFWLWRGYHNERAELKGHADIVGSVAFSPDGKTLAAGSYDKTVKLLEGAARN